MYVVGTVDTSTLPLVCVARYLYNVPNGAVVHMAELGVQCAVPLWREPQHHPAVSRHLFVCMKRERMWMWCARYSLLYMYKPVHTVLTSRIRM